MATHNILGVDISLMLIQFKFHQNV